MLPSTIVTAFVLCITSLFNGVNAQNDPNPEVEDPALINEIVLAKVNYYRAVSGVNTVTWNADDLGVSGVEAMNCSVTNDYWDPRGRMIFGIGRQDGVWPDEVNSTYIAIDHWYAERSSYHPSSDDYNQLQPFYNSWEFTQMVWASSKTIGCDWAWQECDVDPSQQVEGVAKVLQFVCNMDPAGNKWEQWSANVHCADCTGVGTQTTTIDPATISFSDETSANQRRAAPTSHPKVAYTADQIAAFKAELDRVEQYRYLPADKVLGPHFKRGHSNFGTKQMLAKQGVFANQDTTDMETMVHNARAAYAAKMGTAQKRDDPIAVQFSDYYVDLVNKWRASKGVNNQVTFDRSLVDYAGQQIADNSADKCVWPQTQDAATNDTQTARGAWWLISPQDDMKTLADWEQQFDYALHMWDVWGNNADGQFVGSLWTTFYDQLIHPDTKTFGCQFQQNCTEGLPKEGTLLYCIAVGPHVPVRNTAQPSS